MDVESIADMRVLVVPEDIAEIVANPNNWECIRKCGSTAHVIVEDAEDIDE